MCHSKAHVCLRSNTSGINHSLHIYLSTQVVGIDQNSWRCLKKMYQVCVTYQPSIWFVRIYPEISSASYRSNCCTLISHLGRWLSYSNCSSDMSTNLTLNSFFLLENIYWFVSNCLESERFSTFKNCELKTLKYKLPTGMTLSCNVGTTGLN